MAVAAGGRIFCKVFGENILPFGGVLRHPIGYVTFGIIFCRAPNSTHVRRADSFWRRCEEVGDLEVNCELFGGFN